MPNTDQTQPSGGRAGAVAPTRTALRRRPRWAAVDLALIAVFAALLAASVAVPGIPAGPLGVPITLQTLAVALCGLVLGFGRGTAAVGLYILLGLIGLPIFAGFRSGPAVLAGPSAGYIVGFLLAVAAVGFLTPWALRRRRKAGWLFGVAVLGMLVLHASGVAGFLLKGMGFSTAVLADAIYYPADILKNILAVGLALSLHRAFPDLLRRRRT